jgi:tetratricopeptide (TPR) repeat protein
MRIPFISYKSLLAVGAALCISGSSALAADNPPEISESIQSGIAPLAKLYEEKKWVEAIRAIDALLAKSEPNSFDRAFLSGYKAQLIYATGDAVGTIAPLEVMLRIADQQKLFRFTRLLPVGESDTLSTLANLYMQQAAAQGATPEEQRAAYAKAHEYGKRLVSGPKPSADGQFLWARILYSEATINASNVDMTIMKQALAEAEKVLLITIKPKEEHYLLLLACLQQLGDYVRCADMLELMVKQFPNNKSAWPMLFQTYLAIQNMPGKDKDYEISALVALERAQAVGMMSTNKDNFTLAGLYYNIQQYQFAAEILSKGLKNGKIDPDQKNFELLAACYQQMGKDDQAIEVYLEAIRTFPKAAGLEQQIGQMYYNVDKREEALKHLQAAVKKGLEKPVQTLILVSYLSLELKRLDEALVAAEAAVKADPKNKDAQNILGVIKDSIKEREQFKKQK